MNHIIYGRKSKTEEEYKRENTMDVVWSQPCDKVQTFIAATNYELLIVRSHSLGVEGSRINMDGIQLNKDFKDIEEAKRWCEDEGMKFPTQLFSLS